MREITLKNTIAFVIAPKNVIFLELFFTINLQI